MSFSNCVSVRQLKNFNFKMTCFIWSAVIGTGRQLYIKLYINFCRISRRKQRIAQKVRESNLTIFLEKISTNIPRILNLTLLPWLWHHSFYSIYFGCVCYYQFYKYYNWSKQSNLLRLCYITC